MTSLAVIAALVVALCVGYHFGRRASSTPPNWKKRTSRTAMTRLAITLGALLIARRVRHSFLAKRAFPGVVAVWGLKAIEPLQILRTSLARQRFG